MIALVGITTVRKEQLEATLESLKAVYNTYSDSSSTAWLTSHSEDVAPVTTATTPRRPTRRQEGFVRARRPRERKIFSRS